MIVFLKDVRYEIKNIVFWICNVGGKEYVKWKGLVLKFCWFLVWKMGIVYNIFFCWFFYFFCEFILLLDFILFNGCWGNIEMIFIDEWWVM